MIRLWIFKPIVWCHLSETTFSSWWPLFSPHSLKPAQTWSPQRSAPWSLCHGKVYVVWEWNCLFNLEKLVASSQKPTALFEAHCSVQEAVKLWEASSDDLRRLRTILASKVEEAFKNSNNDQKALDEVERVSKLVAAKLEEVETDQKVLYETKKREQKLTDSYWCSFPWFFFVLRI